MKKLMIVWIIFISDCDFSLLCVTTSASGIPDQGNKSRSQREMKALSVLVLSGWLGMHLNHEMGCNSQQNVFWSLFYKKNQ